MAHSLVNGIKGIVSACYLDLASINSYFEAKKKDAH